MPTNGFQVATPTQPTFLARSKRPALAPGISSAWPFQDSPLFRTTPRVPKESTGKPGSYFFFFFRSTRLQPLSLVRDAQHAPVATPLAFVNDDDRDQTLWLFFLFPRTIDTHQLTQCRSVSRSAFAPSR